MVVFCTKFNMKVKKSAKIFKTKILPNQNNTANL